MSNEPRTAANPGDRQRNDGKRLEELVRLIEGHELPHGFRIETGRRIFDEEGVQVAELDIFITGKVGSGSLSYLIECRDRPSDGAAPRSWIEQLMGRRQSLKLDKVMAVSSTGFAPAAKRLAEEVGIELRLLQDLTYEDVAGWLPPTAPLIVRHENLHGVRVYLKPKSTDEIGKQFVSDVNEQRLWDRKNQTPATLLQIWRRVINDPELWTDIPEDGSTRVVKIAVKQEIIQDFTCDHDGLAHEIGHLEFDAELSVAPSAMLMVEAASYVTQPVNPGEEQTIVQLGRWVGDDSEIVKEMIVIGFPKKPTE